MLNWYVVRSKPNKESALWRELCARRLEVFYPRLRVHPVNPRSRTLRPYFPGYLFLHVDLEKTGFACVQWIPFSQGLVTFNGEPGTISDGLVHAIRRRVNEIEAAGGETFDRLKRGDAVLIQDGAFAGYEAIFDARLPGSERARVLLTLMNRRRVPLELNAGQFQRKRHH
ncbi:MAG: hypothetical protein DYG87_09415 [Anaerolineae bacterium CFX3]|jgi:transcriptional antiterminator RfaH|nr:hypothetical protein [Anaerolineae bacterium]MBL1171449.1 hypothetical protein [Chloroflexota bacterium]MBV6467981.1 Transcription antitermination protein RfaH [Anaerolineales bacterium]MCE7906002.1 hypothetical protein [Anaerolineae bacterium CFX3]MDL1926118.1 hypothetical protein [Anaerolineae bacterium AMX1]OQY84313.1 MAG: hypothetical protein B6D40_05610 [Anaerolineae bacterium UTCFX3]